MQPYFEANTSKGMTSEEGKSCKKEITCVDFEVEESFDGTGFKNCLVSEPQFVPSGLGEYVHLVSKP
ncbi:hypothetical protein CEXT_222341 [Caerostris extrusa]|uniref:Uncharacterized protein n=1 Tax=Caerostris extrusa TaxID=172846 RepID=A0AAV4UHM0_CAEEX|nr:hypothetical protein CEXT_222341 [Caerostris extrusa]